jgi:putative flippase GtrA
MAATRPAAHHRTIGRMPGVAQKTERFAALKGMQSGLVRKLLRYGAGSVVATICSQTTFLVVYGPLHASTTLSSALAWMAGAVPNYWINRSWTWGRRGRPSVTRELLPYAGIILATLGLAIAATAAAAAALRGTSIAHPAQTVIVAGVYFLVYVVMFGFRFLLFDRLFATRAPQPEGR